MTIVTPNPTCLKCVVDLFLLWGTRTKSWLLQITVLAWSNFIGFKKSIEICCLYKHSFIIFLEFTSMATLKAYVLVSSDISYTKIFYFINIHFMSIHKYNIQINSTMEMKQWCKSFLTLAGKYNVFSLLFNVI